MELNKIEIEGFKKFPGKRIFSFRKGINVIHGDNEAGKSTILEALVAAISGLTPKEIEEIRNWKSDRCFLSLTYTTDHGETFRLERDFSEGLSAIFKKEKRKFKKIASQQRRVTQILRNHFGVVDKKLLQSTIFIRSKEMEKVGEESNLIKRNLSTLIAGATVNPVETAVEKLKKERKTLEYYKGKGGKIYELTNKLEEAEAKLEGARKDEEDVKKAEKDLNKKKKDLEDKKDKENALGSLLEKHDKKVELETKENEIREQLKTFKAMSQVRKKEPVLLYMGFIIIMISVILAVLLSPWVITAVSIGFILIFLYFKQGIKVKIPKGVQDKIEILHQNLAVIQSELRNYASIKLEPEEAEEKRNKLEKLKEVTEKLEREINGLDSRIKTLKERSHDVAAALADKENLEREIEEEKERIKAYDLAIETLREAERKAYENISPELSKSASKTIKVITDKKYSDLKITSNIEMKIKIPETGDLRRIDFPLSDGTQDQLYLAVRLALSEVLSGGRKLPLLLDESLAFCDDKRFKNCMKIIKR